MRKVSDRRGIVLTTVLLGLLVLGLPAQAQMEADRPVPPGEKPPVTVFTRLADAGCAKKHPDANYLIVLDQSINRVQESGVTYVDLYTLYKVLNEDGAVEMSALRWNYDPRSSFIEVAEVNVIRDGKKISVDVAQVRDLPAPQSAIYWSDRIKLLQLPRLKAGDGIEVVAMRKGYNYALLADAEEVHTGSTIVPGAKKSIASDDDDKYIPPMAGEYFDIVLFQADVPVLEKRYELTLPTGKRLISEVFNGPLYSRTTYTPDSTTYTWWTKDVPAFPHDIRQPDHSDYAPKVVMTTAESWEAKSQWFFDVNRNQFEITDAVQEKVDEILEKSGVKNGTSMEKAKALNHWVAQNIRYSGQTMGEGEGFTLHPSQPLIEYRSGVCKDIASMSITFLRAAGLDAYPAMTMAGSRIEDLPADQFNHCVVAWEREDGSFTMLDPTWVPFNNDIWSKLETEQHYVIGHPDGVDLQKIRYSPPEESPMVISHDATLTEDGTLSGHIRIQGTGASDSRLRRVVYQRSHREMDDYLVHAFSHLGKGISIQNISHRDVEDFTGNMWVEFDYTVPQFALPVAGGLEFTPPALNGVKDDNLFFRAGSYDWEEERNVDVFLYYTQRLDITETIKLPRGWALTDAAQAKVVDETYAALNGEAKMDGRKLSIHTRADVKRRQIPPDGYSGMKAMLDNLDEWAATTLRVTKGGAK
ncbi:DUF3857 domain-containing transglutaminase family protein [bacterium]|nr:DUF3857 domain-containing transglutaminase family protein [bacterium]